MHREAAGSADLHLFQEVSTLGQQFHAHAFAPLGPRQNKDHVSSAHAATAPGLWRCEVRYWHRRAYGIFHWPLPATDTLSLGGSWLRTWGRNSLGSGRNIPGPSLRLLLALLVFWHRRGALRCRYARVFAAEWLTRFRKFHWVKEASPRAQGSALSFPCPISKQHGILRDFVSVLVLKYQRESCGDPMMKRIRASVWQ
jgi:hypothetical protein